MQYHDEYHRPFIINTGSSKWLQSGWSNRIDELNHFLSKQNDNLQLVCVIFCVNSTMHFGKFWMNLVAVISHTIETKTHETANSTNCFSNSKANNYDIFSIKFSHALSHSSSNICANINIPWRRFQIYLLIFWIQIIMFSMFCVELWLGCIIAQIRKKKTNK